VLLIILLVGNAFPVMASVSSSHTSYVIPALSEARSYSHLSGDQGVNRLDTHPFFTEFYLQQFAAEPMPSGIREQRSWFSPVVNPVTSAASNLSKRVANLRRALVRMMP
jgi:hypothetical protein